MSKLSTREKIIKSATRLFYRDGFYATGIAKIVADAGLSKVALYHHFKSKDELILAVLHQFDQRFLDWLISRIEDATDVPEERLLECFDALHDLLAGDAFGNFGYRGCLFVKAAFEFGGEDSPIAEVALQHKSKVMNFFLRLCRAAEVNNPDRLAKGLFLEFEGAYVMAQVTHNPEIANEAREIAKFLIDSSMPD